MRTAVVPKCLCALLFFSFAQLTSLAQAVHPRLHAVEVSAAFETSPPRITLTWPADSNATNYAVSRLNNSGEWTLLTNLSGSATQFVDHAVSIGTRYEYELLKSTSRGYKGSGYVLAGYAPAIESRGKIILLVDSTWTTPLAAELRRLQQDLVGDGWTVLRQDVPRSASVPHVKSIIQNFYSSDPANVRALFLFGHIAVPYSGNFTADNHLNHKGAWPADVFYADIDGTWTDSTVNTVTAEKPWNHNVPGDGKFDQSELPSDVELEMGRVDLFNMTCFANKSWSRNEEYLLRQYLEKDHRFRHGQLPLPRRGLIIDNFGADAENLASAAWRNFAPMFGAQNSTQIEWGTYFSTLNSGGYLWSYANGGGSYYTCAGVGSSDDFALNDIKTVFTFYFGSYFGDWDNESNFLRASLGSTTYALTTSYGSRPHWFVHPMALGQTIGYATKLTQNNDGYYMPTNSFSRKVHTVLHGDPTLRMHPVIPPSNLIATLQNGVTLNWAPSTDSPLIGYHIYRGTHDLGPYARINSTPVTDTTFNDPEGTIASAYMIRAIKLETSASGSYNNLSQGVFARIAQVPAAPSNLAGAPQANGVALSWRDNSTDETGFRIYRRSNGGSFVLAGTAPANATTFLDTTAPSATTNIFAVAAFNDVGESDWSPEVTVAPAGSSAATFLRTDTTTRGNWKGVYGAQGYNIIQNSQNYPSFVSLATFGNSAWTWNNNTTDPAALLRANENTRLAACWYSGSQFEVQLGFSDNVPHRVALYFLDWDKAGRRQTLDILHGDTGALLATRTIESFQNGTYVVYDLQGRVTLRLRPQTVNAVLSGIFFDAAVESVATPNFSPNGGTFTNTINVAINTATTGATIRYTTNGTLPTASSPIYSSPLEISSTTTVRAKAFKSGLADSEIATATFTINRPPPPGSSTVRFDGMNTTWRGTWKGNVGAQGHLVINDSQSLPAYANVTTSDKADWLWQYSTSDTRALQRNTVQSRLAACWYSGTSFDVNLTLTDTNEHRISLYCLDWDRAGRQQTVEVLNAASGQVLHTQTLANFGEGIYLQYTVKGSVTFRFIRGTSYNSVLSGIFFDAPSSP
ncbi:MAG TPA: chitobiase/beta-hexosaminidase C-terminal domain-containing protein [Verrucomicrobiae bacterium]